MSLQVWLPCNGNRNNKGVNPVTFSMMTEGDTYLQADEKLGYAYRNTSYTAGGLVSSGTVSLGQKQSMFCWFKIIRLNSSSSLGGGLVSQHRHTNNTGMGLTIRYVTETSGYLSVNTGNGSSRTYNTYYGTTLLQVNKWYHGGYTYDGSTIRIYVNGVCEKEQAYSGMSVPADYITAFCWSFNSSSGSAVYAGYRFNGFLNDIRVYDHCLTITEIREIYKCLVCHYKLDSFLSTGLTNKYSGVTADGQCSGDFTRTALTTGRGYNYKLTRTGTGSDTWPYLRVGSSYSFTAGKRYYYSCKVRCKKWTVGEFRLRASRSANDWVTNSVVVCNPSLADGLWHEYYTSQIVNSTYDRSGSTVTSAPILEFYASNQNGSGTVYDMEFDIKDIQVVESDSYVPFIQNEYASTIVPDSSGYGYHGTRGGTLAVSTDTARYDLCTSFPANTSTITITPYLETATVVTNMSVSCWFKTNTMNNTAPNLWSLGENSFLRLRLASSTSILFYARLATTSKGFTYDVGKTLTDNTWHHVVLTFNNGIFKLYLDGAIKATADATSTATYLHCQSAGTTWHLAGYQANSENFIGQMSDFRIYSTALTDDDVLRLYNVAGSVAKNGALLSYKMKEV